MRMRIFIHIRIRNECLQSCTLQKHASGAAKGGSPAYISNAYMKLKPLRLTARIPKYRPIEYISLEKSTSIKFGEHFARQLILGMEGGSSVEILAPDIISTFPLHLVVF